MMILAWFAALALLIGTGCLYLAAPHQVLTSAPANPRALKIGGAVALIVALMLLAGVMGTATAVFSWTVGLMLLWSIPPVVIRWLKFRKENAG
jgi:hypothetical protein